MAGLGMIGIILGVVSMVPIGSSLFKPAPVHTVGIEMGIGNSIDDAEAQKMQGTKPYVALWGFEGRWLGDTTGSDPGLGAAAESFPEPGSSLSAQVQTEGQPEYLRILASSDQPVCLAYVTVSNNQQNLAWNAGFGSTCGVATDPASQVLPDGSTYKPPCIWLALNHATYPAAFTVHLTDVTFNSTDVALAKSAQFQAHNETLCKAPARLQFWKSVDPRSQCIPYYAQPIVTNPDGTDKFFAQVQTGHAFRDNCTAGEPWNNADLVHGNVAFSVPGDGSFGGTDGFIPVDGVPGDVPGYGSFGGVESSIPLASAGPVADPSFTPDANPDLPTAVTALPVPTARPEATTEATNSATAKFVMDSHPSVTTLMSSTLTTTRKPGTFMIIPGSVSPDESSELNIAPATQMSPRPTSGSVPNQSLVVPESVSDGYSESDGRFTLHELPEATGQPLASSEFRKRRERLPQARK